MPVAEPNLFISTASNDREAVDWLNKIFLELAEYSISDLHILARQDDWSVRVRTPQGMRDLGPLPRATGEVVSDRIRSRANLSLSDRRTPMDGRFRLRYEDRAIDVRVAITPNIMGSLIVCRILDQARSVINLDQLNLDQRYLMAMRSLLDEPNGIFFITGPTGSGKTTTLYALVNELNDGTRNIITVENPVEYVVPGIAQINVDNTHTTFPNALRTVLRQDPDVILIGEIRDAETAQIAVQAAMTGHLVLATLHTNSAVQAPFRMIDLGVDPKMLAVAMRGVCAQRLLPMIKPPNEGEPAHAWQNMVPTDHSWAKLQSIPTLGQQILSPDLSCKGYLPAMELYLMDDACRDAVAASDIQALRNQVRLQPWYDTLAQSAAFAAFRGLAHFKDAKRLVSTSDTTADGPMRIASSMVESGLLTLDQALQGLEQQVFWRLQGQVSPYGEVLKALEQAAQEEHWNSSQSNNEHVMHDEPVPPAQVHSLDVDQIANGAPLSAEDQGNEDTQALISVSEALALRPRQRLLPKPENKSYIKTVPFVRQENGRDVMVFDFSSAGFSMLPPGFEEITESVVLDAGSFAQSEQSQ